MCKFEYTDRYKKISKVFDYVYLVYTALLVLIVINNIFIKVVAPNTAFDVMCWAIAVIALTEGALEVYKVLSISLPSLDFTLEYSEVNRDDPLQKKVVAQAIEYATSWAGFALKRERSRIRYSAIYKLIFGVLLILLLIF